MIYPFPGYHNPVLGARPLISCFCLLSLLSCCDIAGCRRLISPGSPAPQLTDLRSQISGVEELLEEFRKQLQQQRHKPEEEEGGWQERHKPDPAEDEGWQQRHKPHGNGREGTEEENMQEQLQEVAVRPAGDVGEDLCNFSQLEDYIIRTKDSLEAGATFLKAPAEVYSWKQCLEVCCMAPTCSAAVVERAARGLSCFLFDCTYRGRNVCHFSPHRDYSSFTLTSRNVSSVWEGWAPLRAPSATQGNLSMSSIVPAFI